MRQLFLYKKSVKCQKSILRSMIYACMYCFPAETEGLKTSETAVDNMNSCKTILESICLLAQDLKQEV